MPNFVIVSQFINENRGEDWQQLRQRSKVSSHQKYGLSHRLKPLITNFTQWQIQILSPIFSVRQFCKHTMEKTPISPHWRRWSRGQYSLSSSNTARKCAYFMGLPRRVVISILPQFDFPSR